MSEKVEITSETAVLPTLAYLRECFDYDPDTGALTWKVRPRHHFETDRGWNSANGRVAGQVLKPRKGHDYIQIKLLGRTYVAHRIAYALHHGLDLADVPENIDHRNGRTTDNRISNLRATTFANNAKNRGISANNTTGRKGVCRHSRPGKWQAFIQGKYLGIFDSIEAAGEAYDAAAAEIFGEFAREVPWVRKEVIGNCTLYLGDSRDVLPALPERFDALVTDPPYGIGITKSNRLAVSRGMGGKSWDDAPITADDVALIRSMADHQIIWGGNYFDLPPTRAPLVWDKNNAGRDFADFELAWSNLDMVARRFIFRPMNMDGGKQHPTQKPIQVMQWCLGFLPASARHVLDPFMGSGTTGVACARTGLSFTGIEIDPGYFDIACQRIREAYDQPSMFTLTQAAAPEQLSILDGAA